MCMILVFTTAKTSQSLAYERPQNDHEREIEHRDGFFFVPLHSGRWYFA